MIIVRIPSELAKPFVDQYCIEYGLSIEGGPDWGHNVTWMGAVLRGKVQAVIGYIAIPEGIYVHSYHKLEGTAGTRAFLALNVFTYRLKMNLWGYIRKNNAKMLTRMLKEGWTVALETEEETLVNWSCYN